MIKCKHGITAIACTVCGGKTLTEIRRETSLHPPCDIIIKREDKPMTDKSMCLYCGKEKVHCRGLGSKCWYLWRHGKIVHPELGKWTPSEKHLAKLKKAEEKVDPVQVNHNEIVPEIESIFFREFRQRLSEAIHLGKSLAMIGQGDQVRKEVELFAQKFTKKQK